MPMIHQGQRVTFKGQPELGEWQVVAYRYDGEWLYLVRPVPGKVPDGLASLAEYAMIGVQRKDITPSIGVEHHGLFPEQAR